MPIRKLISLLLISFLLLNAHAQNRVVLMEHYTWMGHPDCTIGIDSIIKMKKKYGDSLAIINMHAGGPLYHNAYPQSYLNQSGVLLPSRSDIDRVYQNERAANWDSIIGERLRIKPVLHINTSGTYHSSARLFNVDIEVVFDTLVPIGAYKIGFALIENGINKTSADYKQANIYAGSGITNVNGFDTLPNPVPAYLMNYNYVLQNHLDYGGVYPGIPPYPVPGTIYKKTLSWTIYHDWNENSIRGIAYVVSGATGEILNATITEYATGSNNSFPYFQSDTNIFAQHNIPFAYNIFCNDPEQDSLTINFHGNYPSWLHLQAKGKNDAILYGTPPSVGAYTFSLIVSDSSKSEIKEFSINIDTHPSNWEYIGQQAFTNQSSSKTVKAAIHPITKDIYSLGVNSMSQAFVYHWSNNTWTQIGNTIPCNQNADADIAINPITSEPWLVTRNSSSGQVFKYSNGNWTQVGLNIWIESDLDIEFTDNGIAYVASNRSNVDPILFKYENNSWTYIPGPNSAIGPLSYTRLQIDSNNLPIILVGHQNPYNLASMYSEVYRYNGISWNMIGNTIYSTIDYTYDSKTVHQIEISPQGNIYIALEDDNGLRVCEWNNGVWQVIKSNIQLGVEGAFDLSSDNSGSLYLAYKNPQHRISCIKYYGLQWTMLGPVHISAQTNSVNILNYETWIPLIVYNDFDYSHKISARKYIFLTALNESSNNLISDQFVFPNPAQNAITIAGDNKDHLKYIILDLRSRIISSGQSQNNSINISQLKKGIYLLRFPESDQTYKFIKTE